MLFKIALSSLIHRKTTVLLTVFSIAISVAIILSVEHIRQEAKSSFTRTISGTDLIVGARSGRINLLLYSVFRIGNATNNISWKSYQLISQQQGIRWAIPISLGDSHKGYRVLGTTDDYFSHYKYGKKQALKFKEGEVFNHVYDVVLGAEVAKKLNYQVGQKIVLSHGITDVSFTLHDDKPFTIVGILEPTGTPVDQTLHISLAGMEAIHVDWKNGAPIPGLKVSAEEALKKDLTPKTITAAYLGLNNKILTFRIQRKINDYRNEPLMAILPGVALSELWQTMNMVEKILALIAALVGFASMLGMITMMLSTLKQRQREIIILRTIGAPTWFIFCLIELEVIFIALAGIILGVGTLWLSMIISQPIIADHYGLFLTTNPFTISTGIYSLIILGIAIVLAAIPAAIAYRQSLGKGLTLRD
ncbi:MAG: ABC transporter permease [Cellvibrionaceae bacterium]